jgi:hypothetical protein
MYDSKTKGLTMGQGIATVKQMDEKWVRGCAAVRQMGEKWVRGCATVKKMDEKWVRECATVRQMHEMGQKCATVRQMGEKLYGKMYGLQDIHMGHGNGRCHGKRAA